MLEAIGAGFGTAEVITIEEAAGEIEELVIIEADPAGEEFGDMNDIGSVSTGEGAGLSDFPLAVGPVTGDDDCIHLGHLTSPAAALARPLSVRRATLQSTNNY